MIVVLERYFTRRVRHGVATAIGCLAVGWALGVIMAGYLILFGVP